MTVLFMGSGPFGVPALERLAEATSDLAVATVPDAPQGRKAKLTPTPIKSIAMARGIPVIETETLRREHGRRVLLESGARLVIVADFRLMLSRSFLAGPERHCYNLHGSVLPRWRGAAPIQHGILAGDTDFGVTLYRMVRGLDAGPVVDHAPFSPGDPLDAEQIEEKLSSLAAELLLRWLPVLLDGEVPLTEQDEREVTLAPKLHKQMGWIDWSHGAAAIQNRIRALKPWPRTFATLCATAEASRVFVDRAVPLPTEADIHPCGTIVSVDNDGLVVACGDGRERIQLLELQRAGKRSLPAAEFVRGTSVAIGDRFTGEITT